MQTLTFNFKKPQNGDPGSIFFPALEQDIQQLNDHTHDGVDSALISSSSITSVTQPILAASWVATSGGTYRQAVTLPAGLTYGLCFISFIFTSTGHQVFPTVEKISSSQYYVYTNDNSLAYTAVYAT